MSSLRHVKKSADSIARNKQILNVLKGSVVLNDYSYWLSKKVNSPTPYLSVAKSCIKSISNTGNLLLRVEQEMKGWSGSMKAFYKKFQDYLLEQEITWVVNDLDGVRLPIAGPLVKLYLAYSQDTLRSKMSKSTYATILNSFMDGIQGDVSKLTKRNVARFIQHQELSDYTKRLYVSVIKSFVRWVYSYHLADKSTLSQEDKKVKKALAKCSPKELQDILTFQVKVSGSLSKTYHKDSLSKSQRDKMLKGCKEKWLRAAIALMAWNGLRTIEVLRLTKADIDFKKGRIAVWSKGKNKKSKDTIRLSSTARKEVSGYLKLIDVKRGPIMKGIDRLTLEDAIKKQFRKLKLKGRYTPHSLRHTAGQLMYERKIPLEIIQKTLRHADLRTTMVYAQRAVDNQYFKRLKRF